MPAVSKKQQRFMGMCASGGVVSSAMKCPPKAVAKKFAKKPPGGYKNVKRKNKANP